MPKEEKLHKLYKPKDDNEVLEQIAFIIFIMGFNYAIVKNRWSDITKAFQHFDIEKVAKMDNEKLTQKKGMIKNRVKIQRIINNAKLCHDIKLEHGSVLKWIAKAKRAAKKDPMLNPQLSEHFEVFEGIGQTTAGWLERVHNTKGSFVEWIE